MAQSSCVALWQATVAPDEPHKFARRLSWDGLSEEGFERWLKSNGTEHAQGFPSTTSILLLPPCRSCWS